MLRANVGGGLVLSLTRRSTFRAVGSLRISARRGVLPVFGLFDIPKYSFRRCFHISVIKPTSHHMLKIYTMGASGNIRVSGYAANIVQSKKTLP